MGGPDDSPILWPKADTAFVVTHGNLPKDPYWVIDRFANGLVAAFEAANEGKSVEIRREHRLRRRADEADGPGEWVESYVRLTCNASDACIDIHEYFWDVYMVQQPSWSSLREWLGMLASNAMQLHLRRKEQASPTDDPEYRWGRAFIGLWGLAWGLSGLLSWIPGAGRLIFLPKEMARFASDTTTYLATTVRSGDYRIRRQILDGAVRQVASVLDDPLYGQVVLAGHSLGSIIMYDVINRLRRDACAPPDGSGASADSRSADAASLERLHAFVSFGSPLDKVAYFFHRRVPDDEDVRRGIVDHLHGFRRKKVEEPVALLDVYGGRAAKLLRAATRGSPAPEAAPGPSGSTARGAKLPLKDPMCSLPLDGLTWLNFYHVLDGAAGHLDAYSPVDNVACDTPVRKGLPLQGTWRAHGSYWESRAQSGLPGMYDIIVDHLFSAPRAELVGEAEGVALEEGSGEAESSYSADRERLKFAV